MTNPWRHDMFQSGTQIVSRSGGRRPHFYVYGPAHTEDDDAALDRARAQMCQDLCAWLNGGAVPTWLAGMTQSTESPVQIVDDERRSIRAVGPYIESEPGRGDWKQDDAAEWVAERRYMIVRLLAGERP